MTMFKGRPIKSYQLCASCEYGYYNLCRDGCDLNCKCHDIDTCYCTTVKNGEQCARYKKAAKQSADYPFNRGRK